MKWAAATAPSRTSKIWSPTSYTWDDLVTMLNNPGDTKDCGGYVLGSLKGRRRGKNTVLSRSGLTLDADEGSPLNLPELVAQALPGTNLLAHTTFSSTPDNPRWRIIVPFNRSVTPDEYRHIAKAIMAEVDCDAWDLGSEQPERMMFRPSTQRPDWYCKTIIAGEPLDPEPWLLDHVPSDALGRHRKDPTTLTGVVGAFNRVYDIESVIKAYDLPYEEAEGDRWHLVGASAEAGMRTLENGTLAYSHHAHDPAHGSARSAFDLVRLHRFADRDEGCDPATPVTRLPSHEAMTQLAMDDLAVTAELFGSDFTSELDQIEQRVTSEPDQVNWKAGLKLNAKTGAMLDRIENWDSVVAHEPVFDRLAFNELTYSIELTGDAPWRKHDPKRVEFTSADMVELRHHLEREYHLRPSENWVEGLVLVNAHKRRYSPVLSYLEGLEWDGVSRLETCLPGVVPTPYTRMVARKCFTAAVARAFEPGCKWDHVLVLQGDQSLGKTWWCNTIFKGWVAPLGRLDSKDTLLTVHRSWMVLADEGYSLRKADADMMKEFLTRNEDVFRLPYERQTLAYPRKFVIWSTTNDATFLRNEEGNRRYLPVKCQSKVDFDAVTPAYVDQLWAEAVALYRAGERLFLDEIQSAEAKQVQAEFTEEDALAGIIEAYLETPKPEDWESITPQARLDWLANVDAGFTAEGNHRIDRVCSSQLHSEALRMPPGRHTRLDLLQISRVLKQLPGWKQLPGRVRLPYYGAQTVFVRCEDETQQKEEQHEDHH